MSKHAIIIGAGVAGPTLGLFLKRLGITSAVYEAYAGRKDLGEVAQGGVRRDGGFQIAPNGMNVLRELGLSDSILKSSAISEIFRFVRPDGRLLGAFRNGRTEVNGVPAVNTTRTAIIGVLFDAATSQGVPIHLGKRLVDVVELPNGGGVEARFEDGSSARGDFLVGADGLRSTTRSILFPNASRPTYSGLLGFGGSVPVSAVSHVCSLLPTTLTFVLGPAGQFGYVRVSHDLCNWWSHVPRPVEPTKTEIRDDNEEIRARLLERHSTWHEPIPTVIRATEEITTTPVYTLPRLARWHKGNAILVGDAAHGTSPSAGQGASIALEDAMYLAKLLRNAPSMTAAFEQFERDRRPRAERVQAVANKRDARELQALGPVACWLRDGFLSLTLPLMGERDLRWQYEHRIPWND